jgi:NADH:ubiquinone oxidoreductase subunit 5 (subunit L)/multisubunit Na+/H+ antiporter MnhA subunit
MLIVVTLISFLVHFFSLEYMREDKMFSRFYAYLGLFTFSMLGIVIANNFLNMFIFWELVGVSSYLLIGFWFHKDSAANAGKKAFITNRIGDLGFLIGLMILFNTYGTFMFDDVFGYMHAGILPYNSGLWLSLLGIFVFMGAIGKSAQFPLHVWLPDAMEGPTPVSALIHAATMVAAGVYLTARVYPMFTADALLFIAYVGALTALIAATIALTQFDFKRVLAYSTVSQLGYMVMGLGVGAFTSGYMHLVTHAWFKALLFLGSGSVIHAMHHSMHHAHNHDMDPQDIRNMGGLRKTMPITYITFLFATIAISGIPLTSGFLSKDGILAGTLAFANLSGHWFIPIAGFGAAMLTAFYMFRLTIVSFHGKPKTDIAHHTKENNGYITAPLVLLAVLTFWFFYSFNPFGADKGWFHKATQPPKSAVPPSMMWSFMNPEGGENAECCPEEGSSHHGDASKLPAGHPDISGNDSKDCSMHSSDMAGCEETCKDAKDCKPDMEKCEGHGKDMKECKSDNSKCESHGEEMSKGCCDEEMTDCKDSDKECKFAHAEPFLVTHAKKDEGGHGGDSHGGAHKAETEFIEGLHHFHIPAMILSLCVALTGILVSFVFYQFKTYDINSIINMFPWLYRGSFNKWFFDEIYQATFINGTVGLAKVSAWFDLNIVDGVVNFTAAIGRGVSKLTAIFDFKIIDGLVDLSGIVSGWIGATVRKTQTGLIQTYLVLTVLGIIALILIFI